MSNQKAISILNNFNENGWDEISPYFGDFETFYNYMKKNGLSEQLSLDDIPDEYLNILLIAKINENPEETLKYVCDNYITDVTDRGGEYYLYLRDREELSGLFRDSSRRDYSSRDAAKAVLGEDGYEPYWDTTNDVYRDVIEELDKENLIHLGNYIVENLKGVTLTTEEYDDEYFNEIADEDGNITITHENVVGLIGDEEAMNHLMRDDLSELKSELYSIHNNAYNGAYTDELWNDVMNGLSEFFEGGFLDETIKRGDKTVWVTYIKIRDFQKDVLTFLHMNEDSSYSDSTLDYYGSYVGMMDNLMDNGEYEYIDFRIPDYPDFRQVNKNINELVKDYI
jgi:hypothetical protein